MSHSPALSSSFYSFLQQIDHDVVVRAATEKCSCCGGILDRADFPRKPRGVPDSVDTELFSTRYALCCRKEGCRKRILPKSIRFMGRRIYLMFFVILASSPSSRGTHEFIREAGVSRQTLSRWRRWWRKEFVSRPWWRLAKGLFTVPPEVSRLPESLLEAMNEKTLEKRLVRLLILLVNI